MTKHSKQSPMTPETNPSLVIKHEANFNTGTVFGNQLNNPGRCVNAIKRKFMKDWR